MDCEWDEQKKRLNLDKHGLSFEDAPLVFAEACVTFEDDRFDYKERRLVTLGPLASRVVVIVHTPREEPDRLVTRIISMRKANERERQIYQKRLEAH